VWVFCPLRFVEDDDVPRLLPQGGQRAEGDLVGGEHHGPGREVVEATRSAVVDDHREHGRERRQQVPPVVEDAARADDEVVGVRCVGAGQAQQRHGLVGLAQPHVVGQQRTEPGVVEPPEPRRTVLLVRPQAREQPRRLGERRDRIQHGVDHGLELGAPHRGRHPDLGERPHEPEAIAHQPPALQLQPGAEQCAGVGGPHQRPAPAHEAVAQQLPHLGPLELAVAGPVLRPQHDLPLVVLVHLDARERRL